MKILFLSVILTLTFITGCSENSYQSENPDASEVLELNSNADIFQWGGLIYSTGIDWVDELELVVDKQIGEINNKSDKPADFSDGTANKLPIGTKIYSVKEKGNGILIVEINGVQKRYLALVEG